MAFVLDLVCRVRPLLEQLAYVLSRQVTAARDAEQPGSNGEIALFDGRLDTAQEPVRLQGIRDRPQGILETELCLELYLVRGRGGEGGRPCRDTARDPVVLAGVVWR